MCLVVVVVFVVVLYNQLFSSLSRLFTPFVVLQLAFRLLRCGVKVRCGLSLALQAVLLSTHQHKTMKKNRNTHYLVLFVEVLYTQTDKKGNMLCSKS